MSGKSGTVLGVIPARLQSQRLPRKVLLDLAGKPMLQWVYESARQSSSLDDLIVATDSDEILELCETISIPALKTGEHLSGSDRLHEVMVRTDAEIYVNIQGDEPLIHSEHIDLLVSPFVSQDCRVSTLKVAISGAEAANPNVVKVVTDDHGKALYFSRHPIPYNRDEAGGVQYFKHIGIYAYRREALATYHALPQSSLEVAERLEQLRLLQNGISIDVLETRHDTIGVDTPDDLKTVCQILLERHQ